MTLNQNKKIPFLLLILAPLLFSCGGSEEEEKEKEKSSQTNTSQNTMQINQENQEKVEQDATESLDSITIEGNFEFSNQKMITIDLYFSMAQFQEGISIYSSRNTSSNTLVNLLEQGTINQSNRYKSMLTVPTTVGSIIVVRNGELSKYVEVNISKDSLVTHTFQE